MNLLEKLDMLKRKTGDTNASLARKSGIPYTTIDGFYKKGYMNMKLSTLQSLCEYFNVTLDYLAVDSESIKSEDELVNAFRSLNDEGKTAVLEFVEVCSNMEKYRKKQNLA